MTTLQTRTIHTTSKKNHKSRSVLVPFQGGYREAKESGVYPVQNVAMRKNIILPVVESGYAPLATNLFALTAGSAAL